MPSNLIDKIAGPDDKVQVEVLREVGFLDRMKLYVHVNGETILRICKIEYIQVDIQEPRLKLLSLKIGTEDGWGDTSDDDGGDERSAP